MIIREKSRRKSSVVDAVLCIYAIGKLTFDFSTNITSCCCWNGTDTKKVLLGS